MNSNMSYPHEGRVVLVPLLVFFLFLSVAFCVSACSSKNETSASGSFKWEVMCGIGPDVDVFKITNVEGTRSTVISKTDDYIKVLDKRISGGDRVDTEMYFPSAATGGEYLRWSRDMGQGGLWSLCGKSGSDPDDYPPAIRLTYQILKGNFYRYR
jgi:hypothetical protein